MAQGTTRDVPGAGREIWRVPKEKVAVEVLLEGGRTLSGDLFVLPRTGLHEGRERVIDVLGSSDPFLPLATPEGGHLLNKGRIVAIRVPSPTDTGLSGELEGIAREETVLTLASLPEGDRHWHGVVWIEMPENRRRLLDLLNDDRKFVPLQRQGAWYLLSCRHLLDIRIL